MRGIPNKTVPGLDRLDRLIFDGSICADDWENHYIYIKYIIYI